MNQRTFVTLLFVIIIAITAYFLMQPATNQRLSQANQSIQELEARLAELRHLKDVRFDTSVLQDAFFKSLSTPVIPPPPDIKIGRANPFIPF